MLINHHMFSFRMRVNTFQAPFLYRTSSRVLPLIFHLPNFHIIKKVSVTFVLFLHFHAISLCLPLMAVYNTLEIWSTRAHYRIHAKRKAYIVPCKLTNLEHLLGLRSGWNVFPFFQVGGGGGMNVKRGPCGLKTKLLPFKVPLGDSLHPECAELSLCHWWLVVEPLVDGSWWPQKKKLSLHQKLRIATWLDFM